MHIKHIHDMIEKLSECAKCEMDKGLESMDAKELGEVAEIIKELAEAEYYAKISKAMDEAEYGEDYDYMGAYDEQSRKGYRGQRRDNRGRYMSNRGRRGYEEQMYYTMTPEMYREHDPEYYRDLDRDSLNRMYYSSGNMGSQSSGMSAGQSSGGSSAGNASFGGSSGSRGYYEGNSQGRDSREGRSGQSRRGYMEAKEQGKEKGEKMKNLEDYMKSIAEDITEAIEGASPEERSMTKQKLQMIAQKM